MKIIRKSIAVILALMLLSGTFMCFAADGAKEYFDYDKILLLGDSEASGFTDYGDEMSEFTYVPVSYAAYIANDLGAELIPMACPGFRTIELRYMLDDSYRPDDKYLFDRVPRTPKDEIIAKSPEMRQAIKDSDLIVIGIGGNDWGAYLGWVMEEVQLEYALDEEFKAELIKLLKNAKADDDLITKIVDLANYFSSFDELMVALPEALNYSFSNLRKNWNYIVEYIYENNPDVTLVAVGMFPTTLKTAEGAPDVVLDYDPMALEVEQMIIDFGNKHMVDNIEKYGYIYVDTAGTVCETCHPTAGGHRFIADRILEELPDARFAYSADVSIRNPQYKAIEYMTLNGIMSGTSETAFSPAEALTEDVLASALGKITGSGETSDSTAKVTKFSLASAVFKSAEKKSITDFFAALKFALGILTTGDSKITRAEGAEILYSFINL